ncbi:MAG: hypothetical protein ABFS45_23515 [Pseudomonadota bacterium]
MAHHTNQHIRTQIAQEAAKIILEEGVNDYQLAKRKAIERLRVNDRAPLPRNVEIETAIRNHQKLFYTQEDYSHQFALWKAALESMRFLQPFKPRLVGSLLNGTAGKDSSVNIHVFADALEDVLIFFLNASIPYQSAEQRVRLGTESRCYPMLRHRVVDIEIETVVFPDKALRAAPHSAIDGKPMKRAEISEVEKRAAAIYGKS